MTTTASVSKIPETNSGGWRYTATYDLSKYTRRAFKDCSLHGTLVEQTLRGLRNSTRVDRMFMCGEVTDGCTNMVSITQTTAAVGVTRRSRVSCTPGSQQKMARETASSEIFHD